MHPSLRTPPRSGSPPTGHPQMPGGGSVPHHHRRPSTAFRPSSELPHAASDLERLHIDSSSAPPLPTSPPPYAFDVTHTGRPGRGGGGGPAGETVVRTFDVLLTTSGGKQRWYERGVACARAADLCGILQSRLGFPVPEVLYQGQPFDDRLFSAVPSELKLEIGRGGGPGSRHASRHAADAADGPNFIVTSAPQRRLVSLLVEEAPTRMTFECHGVDDLLSRMREAGITGEVLLKSVTAAGEEVFQPLTSLDSVQPDQVVRVVRRSGSATPSRAYAASGRTHVDAVRTPQYDAEAADPVSVQHVVVEVGNLLLRHDAMDRADDETVARATALVTQQFKQMYTTTAAPHHGRRPTPEELAYLERLVANHVRTTVGAPASAALASTPGGGGGGGTPGGSSKPSKLKSVTFGVSGAFPAAQVGAGLQNVVSLSPPPTAEEGKSVVVIVHVSTHEEVDIRCTLGYENEYGKVLVINMDEFYVNEWVSIGKTSPSSLFISFQPDVLRAGVRYFFDVTAFGAASQKVGSSQIDVFIQPAAVGGVRNNAAAADALASTAPVVVGLPDADAASGGGGGGGGGLPRGGAGGGAQTPA
eukprot:Rhum_TRINITY_DN15271_c23_g1::Rhum_TRINITY_DN15271_c23_g1_i1::g.149021::m.149021